MKFGFVNVVIFLLLILKTLQLCTSGSCLYCDSDGGIIFCKKCGNRKVITGIFPDVYCGGSISIKHCWEVDSKNHDLCITCLRGYYLTEKNKCKKIPIRYCLVAAEVN
jgi:hypothetical protein